MALLFGATGRCAQIEITSVDVVYPTPPAGVPKYTKVELLVTLANVAATEFYEADPAYSGLDLSATFVGPGDVSWHVHGFYDGSSWRIRFAPNETGTWNFSVTATDSSGTDTWVGGSFTCTTSSYQGWVRIDGHHLRFSEGQTFFGVGHNNGWQYEGAGIEQPSFPDMAANGENLLSFWLATPWAQPSWASDEQPWWAYRAPIQNIQQGIDNYNQAACAYLDGVVERAEAAGVYLLPTIWSHGQLREWGNPWPQGWWANNAYSTYCSAAEFFQTTSGGSDTTQWRYQKNFYRYLIARYGYSRAIAGWVGLCEIDGTTGYVSNPAQAEDWCTAVRNYFAANDLFRRNASGQYPIVFTKTDWDSSWNTWSATFDLRSTDSYEGRYDDTVIADAIASETKAMWGTGKPSFHAEFGGDVLNGATQPTHLHNGIWAGLATGAAMTPLVWCDGIRFPMLTTQMQSHLQYLAQFTAGITPSLIGNPDLVPATVTIPSPCRAWGMKVADAGFAWIQNTDGTMGGQTLTVSDLAPGTYSVLWYDVWTSGSTVFTSAVYTVTGRGRYKNKLICTIPNLGRADIAVKFGARPTVAVVSAFHASSQNHGVRIIWETASETGTVGFYVIRRDEATGLHERVTGRLLPCLLHSPGGGRYGVFDPTAEPGKTYSYTLVEVEAGGRERCCGQCRVTVEKGASGSAAGATTQRLPRAERFAYERAAHEFPEPRALRANKPPRSRGAGRFARRVFPGRAAVKIGVKRDGLYYVDASTLAPLLGVPDIALGSLVRHGLLALSCQGKTVAYLPAKHGRGIYFYGQGLDSIYTDENIYWLKLGRGKLMRELRHSHLIPATETDAFVDTVHAEQNYWPATGLFHDPEADFWLWAYLVAGSPGADRKSFIVRTDGAAPAGKATLKVHLKGATEAADGPDHCALVAVNGTVVGEGRWDGTEDCTLELEFDARLLLDGANTLSVEAVLLPESPYSIFYVDSFDLRYRRYYNAVGNSLLCRANVNPVVTVDGFTEPAVSVFDVTEPLNPALVQGAAVEQVDGGYRVSFAAREAGSVYLATTPSAARSPSSVRPDQPSRLKWRGNRAAYLVIAPRALKATAERLAEYRQRQGLSALVVDLEDIYDEFAYGIATPKAIQSFLTWAHREWREPPRYVLLAGHGTWDYKDYLGYEDNLLPSLLVDTAYGLFGHDGELSRQLAIGRLPAKTAADLGVAIAKLIAYEHTEGNWRERALMIADNPDPAGNFPRDSDDLAKLFPKRYTVDRIYLSESPLEDARGRLLAALDAGALLVNYIGHGGMAQWAHEGLLTSGDVNGLSNGSRLPVVVALTCVSTRFAFPGYDCIGEAFVVKPEGGAVAVWGASGLSQNDEAKGLGQRFIQAALGRPGARLGDAILRASAEQTETSKTYNLLGDPALRLRMAR